MIRKEGGKFVLRSKSTGKCLGTHASKSGAEAQEAAINISKARNHIPKRGKTR